MWPLGVAIKPRYDWAMTKRFDHPPSLADLDDLAREALRTIPEELRVHADDVIIRVVEFPDEDTVREMGLASPFELSGLYSGVPIGDKSVSATPADIDMILLYRRPLLDEWCETGEDLTRLIRHVLIHEIGHHFGFSDADMARIEAEE
jgi:predicted Zn-dependent protease with MMP-like domain